MGIRDFFVLEVLNDSRSVLLLLKAKFSGGVLDDRRTEAKDYRSAPGWGRAWADSGSSRYFHQYGEIVLQAAQPGYEKGGISL